MRVPVRRLLALAVLHAPLAAQLVLDGPTVRVVYDAPRRGLAVNVLSETAAAEEMTAIALGLATPKDKTVEITPDQAGLDARVRALTGGPAPDWAGAVAIPSRNLVLVRADAPRGAHPGLRGLLAHEYAHLALHAARATHEAPPFPRWVEEGLAQYAAGRLRPEETVDLRPAAFLGRLKGPVELEALFGGGEGAAATAYAQADAFVRSMALRHGWTAPRRLVRALTEGSTLDAAVVHATGFPLESEWNAFAAELAGDRSWLWSLAGQVLVAVFLTGVAVLGLARRRRRRLQAEAAWSKSEPDAASPGGTPPDGVAERPAPATDF
ncbi:MAG TPA: hypothetical protein VEI02_06805 [Planctomycetota bacterium]|nr:hypothetical protein [Planctomycetota bacterium]